MYDGQLTRGQIVLIDRDAGIRAGGTAILPGPLPADASYDLYLGPDAAGQFRTGHRRPAATPLIQSTQALRPAPVSGKDHRHED